MAAYKARLSPAGPKSSAPAGSDNHDQLPLTPPPPEQTLLSISADAREAVLMHLNAAELCQCQLVCRGLRAAATADSLWRRLCVHNWPQTDAAAWLSPDRDGNFDCDSLGDDASFSTYRQLYPALLRYDTIIGVWREPADTATSLYRIRWGRSCIEGTRLVYDAGTGGPQITPCRRIFGENSVIRVEHLTANECTLAIPRLPPLHKAPSEGAQAAAAVATNRAASAGSSPPDSMYHEIAHWMEKNIAKPRRRGSRGSLHGHGLAPPPNLYHLLRVQRPMPSRKHPLAGLWRGADPNSVPTMAVIISLTYDFSGGAARIVATPVQVSHDSYSADRPIWTAAAAPVRKQDFLVDFCHTVLMHFDAPQRKVASFHEAKKQRSDMFSSSGPGRLVVFEDGGMGFFWTEDEQPILVKYNRIDADFP